MIPDDSGIWIRLRPAICVTIGVLGTLVLLKQMLIGNILVGAGAFLAIVIFSLFLWLGSRYWMLTVVAMMTPMPVVPFGPRWMMLSELVVPLAFVFFLASRAVHRSSSIRFVAIQNVTVLAYTAWAAMIYCMHPSGFLVFGSDFSGARFYLKIALGFLSFMILSNQRIEDRDAKWVVFLILAGSVLQALCGISQWVFGTYQTRQDEFYLWQQTLAAPLLWLSLFLFCRYGVNVLLRIPSVPGFLYAASFIASLFTGKRMGVAGMAMVPFVTATITRQGILKCAIWTLALGLLTGGLVAGQGRLYHLPLLVQRSIAYLPGRWDVRVRETTSTEFRERLRARALEIAKEKPLFGLEGYAIDIESLPWQTLSGPLSESDLAASGRNWHTTWLGIAADFGIPAAVIWGFFYLQFGWVAHKTHKIKVISEYQHVLVLMIYVDLVIEIVRSVTGGHSALLAYDMWWLYGLVVAIQRTLSSSKDQVMPSVPHAEPG
jgi:hypothetical protein